MRRKRVIRRRERARGQQEGNSYKEAHTQHFPWHHIRAHQTYSRASSPRACFQVQDTPTRILRSTARSTPCPNCLSRSPLTELRTVGDSDLESLVSAAPSEKECRLYTTTTHLASEEIPQQGTPLGATLLQIGYSTSSPPPPPPRLPTSSKPGCARLPR